MKKLLFSLFGAATVALLMSVSSVMAQTQPTAAPAGAPEATPTGATEEPVQDTEALNKALPSFLQYQDRDANANLSIPHRTQSEVLIWSNQTVSSILSFDASISEEDQDYSYKKHFASYKKKFLKTGWQQFRAYLKKHYMVERVIDREYEIIAINEGHSFVARHGTVKGVYRWDVEIPILLSYMDMKAPRSKDPKAEPPVVMNEAAKVVISVTRVGTGGGSEQLAIAGWRVTDQKRRKIVKFDEYKPTQR